MKIGRSALAHWWGRESFVDEVLRDPKRSLLLAPDGGGKPVAFIDIGRQLDEIQVHNIATHPGHRRRGFAASLLEQVIDEAPKQGVRSITLEVRRSNEAAIQLYRRFGFETIGVRPLYYSENRSPKPESKVEDEDALFMKLDLP